MAFVVQFIACALTSLPMLPAAKQIGETRQRSVKPQIDVNRLSIEMVFFSSLFNKINPQSRTGASVSLRNPKSRSFQMVARDVAVTGTGIYPWLIAQMYAGFYGEPPALQIDLLHN
jgi:hypothetical protein